MFVTYSVARAWTPTTSLLCTAGAQCIIQEYTFDNGTTTPTLLMNNNTFTGSFGAVYSGSYRIASADQYGGAGGTGKYISATPGSSNKFALTFTPTGDIPGVDYLGLWFSALDSGNEIVFHFSDSSTTYVFNAQSFISLVGSCPGTGFCGNPTTTFSGQNNGQQYAYLNFFYTGGGLINSVDFIQIGSSGNFESDNHTIGYMTPLTPSGTLITSNSPEPAAIGLSALGLGLLFGMHARRRRGGPLGPDSVNRGLK